MVSCVGGVVLRRRGTLDDINHPRNTCWQDLQISKFVHEGVVG